jgi:hypothetical protein
MIKELISGNVIFNQYRSRWQYLYQSYIGGQEYRNAGYLTRYQNETNKEYQSRCDATPLDNHCRSVISVYNSFLFREEPERDFGQYEELPEIESFLKDADFEGRSLNNFMKEVSTWSHVFGHCWIIMSKPNMSVASLAQEQMMGIRPYVSLLTPLTVLDWRWSRSPEGRYYLSYLKYVEEVNGDVTTFKEWSTDEIKTYEIDTIHETLHSQTTDVNGLGYIPAIIAYSERSIIRGIGVSSIDDISDMQRYIYNALSEADQSIRLDSHPSLVATPDSQVGTGAGSIIQIPDNLDPGLKPYILDFNGASIDSIYTVINNTINSIEKASNIGAVRTTDTQVKSGVALQTEFQLLNAKLSAFADNLESAEEQMWRIFCDYQAIIYDFCINYPGSFEIHDSDNEIQQLQVAKSAATDPRILAAIDARILDWLDLDDDEIMAMNKPNLLDLEAVPEVEDIYIPVTMQDPITNTIITTTTADEQLTLAEKGWFLVE